MARPHRRSSAQRRALKKSLMLFQEKQCAICFQELDLEVKTSSRNNLPDAYVTFEHMYVLNQSKNNSTYNQLLSHHGCNKKRGTVELTFEQKAFHALVLMRKVITYGLNPNGITIENAIQRTSFQEG